MVKKAKESKFPPVTFTRLYAISDDVAVIACAPDANDPIRSKFTLLSQYAGGEWTHSTVDFATQSMALFTDQITTEPTLCVLGWEGELAYLPSTAMRDILEPEVRKELKQKYKLGSMTRVRLIGQHLYACGFCGQNYKREISGVWHPFDETVFDIATPGPEWAFELYPPEPVIGFFPGMPVYEQYFADKPAQRKELERRWDEIHKNTLIYYIAGAAENDIYACGKPGIVMHSDGGPFRRFDVPNDPFVSICINEPDDIWISGREGRVLRGNALKGFRVELETKKSLTSMTKFKGKYYFISINPDALFCYDEKSFSKVEINVSPEVENFNTLSATENALWVISSKDILRFDGETWERIQHPVNPARK